MTGKHEINSDGSIAGMGVRDYVRVARLYWRSIAVVTVLVTALVTLWAALQPRTYAAESSALVLTVGSDSVNTLLTGDALAKSKIKNYESIAESRLIADQVIAAVGLNTTADALLPSVSVNVPVDTAEIRITATSPDPLMAQRVADAWVTELAKRVQLLESSVTAGQPTPPALPVGLVPLDKAALPTAPISPNIRLALLFGAVGGLLLAYAAALLRHHLDRRLRSSTEIERLFDVPVIGTLPYDPDISGVLKVLGTERHKLTQAGERNRAFVEALRALRTNLKFLDVDHRPRIILVTSPMTSDGKSTVASNLAVTMAATGEPVVVVDGDLRRPRIAGAFNLVPGVGVTNVLSGQAQLVDVIQAPTVLSNLSIVGSGPTPPNPSELLGTNAMKQLLSTLAAGATVLIDAPPLLPVTDAAVLSSAADGVIVVARAGQTTRDEFERSLRALQKVQAPVLGAIFNCVPTKGVDSYAYYGAYTASPEAATSGSAGRGVEGDRRRTEEDGAETRDRFPKESRKAS
ncbi:MULTISPECIES: polysaccharide biosynthesis tyrosine autokinase [Micrococcaceae]|uniref:Polysaccharide biosynthesis tyrosine autokinase n=1 Tax=Arthrobacter sedimenti TaxID=2694931 RepID=A0ABV8WKI0_9MICC|nr:polysaccharide biosynthesis tyrosine autokinase [Pseudarthrobacter defluvii]WJH24523.1 polysaccharide biosynthesis tyrosine autokinase [Pseudarthrobacter defluvii]